MSHHSDCFRCGWKQYKSHHRLSLGQPLFRQIIPVKTLLILEQKCIDLADSVLPRFFTRTSIHTPIFNYAKWIRELCRKGQPLLGCNVLSATASYLRTVEFWKEICINLQHWASVRKDLQGLFHAHTFLGNASAWSFNDMMQTNANDSWWNDGGHTICTQRETKPARITLLKCPDLCPIICFCILPFWTDSNSNQISKNLRQKLDSKHAKLFDQNPQVYW